MQSYLGTSGQLSWASWGESER